jgi:lipid-binding SYLF domain-containing protein
MKHVISLLILVAMVSAFAFSEDKEDERIKQATAVLKDSLKPEDVPQGMLDKASCVMVLPSVKKAAFMVGASYGRGIMTCRSGADYTGKWSAPALYALEQGSIGLQIGGQATDFLILVMNERGAESLLKSKAKLGADASIAAGPVGKAAEAATNLQMKADMLSYSNSSGAFAGVSLAGGSLRADGDANKTLYGEKVTAREILREDKVKTPEVAKPLVGILDERSPKKESAKAQPAPKTPPKQ